ncbi:hypothetical protein F0L17_14240 [Streptomyces sp. TRM43335]|uniref:Uncharacterized protein n=1 Tax=Streptomyces taklimakanensis TaxID=2569853 RepID=A0A6G2BD99_9ACTN|nr:hypothetical protein [Streptomyces taklimakanensis]MTE20247.1 hypothetical protein [Streptomyces taklimakanensis]
MSIDNPTPTALSPKRTEESVREPLAAERLAEVERLRAERDAAYADAEFAEKSRDRWRTAALEAERERDEARARVAELEQHTTTARAETLREAADVAAQWISDCQNCAVELEVAAEFRRMAAEAGGSR